MSEREDWDGTCPTCGQPNRTGEVTIDRSVIADALEQIEDTWRTTDYTGGGEECASCGVGATEIERGTATHAPDCRYVRVRDALKKALGL